MVDSAGPIAREHRHAYVGTEHLLRAFFVEPECVATNVLAGQGITQEAVEAAIQAIVPDGDTVQDGETPLTPRASHVLQAAPTVAVGLGHNYVGTEHILLALYHYPGGVAAKVLTELGLDEDTARTKVTEALA